MTFPYGPTVLATGLVVITESVSHWLPVNAAVHLMKAFFQYSIFIRDILLTSVKILFQC